MSVATPADGDDSYPRALDERDYVPVILTRQGERLALRETTGSVKNSMTPLLVIHPIDNDLDTGMPKRSAQEHLAKLAEQLLNDWGQGSAFVDLQFVGRGATLDDGSPAVTWITRKCAENGLILSPVYSASDAEDDRRAAIDAASEVSAAIAWRLTIPEWVDLGTGVGDGRIMSLLAEAARPPDQVHVLLDLSDQVSTPPDLSAAAVRGAIRALSALGDWRSVVVIGTGMPTGTADVGPDGTAEIPRSEWLLWRLLRSGDHRVPTFGDYCVQHPNPMSDFDPRMMQSAAQLRYTIPRAWFVARGRGIRSRGTGQVVGLAQRVVNHPHYAGPDFSWGDRWLQECADETCSTGNQMIWRKVTTNHHLAFVVRQLASLFET